MAKISRIITFSIVLTLTFGSWSLSGSFSKRADDTDEKQRSDTLLSLGHTEQIRLLRNSANRLLSQDDSSHWVLWNTDDRQEIMNGNAVYVDLKGNTLAVAADGGVQLFSATDQTLMAEISTDLLNAGLATDGSYFWSATNYSITAWSLSGEELFNINGDYSGCEIFADVSYIRLVGGPSGFDVVETISLDTGKINISESFSGTFHSWFLDGSHFLSEIGMAVYVYSADANIEALVDSPATLSLGGSGPYFWTHQGVYPDYPLRIYKIGSGDTPVETINTDTRHPIVPTEKKIAILFYGDNSFTIVHLGTDITTTSHEGSRAYLSAFGAEVSGSWSIGNQSGVVFDNLSSSLPFEEKAFGYGRVRSISGSSSGFVAVATASGQILVFYISSDSRSLNTKIMYDSSALKLSSDGSVLASQANKDDAQYSPDVSLTVFSLPSATVIREWEYSYPTSTGYLFDFDLSLNGITASRFDGIWGHEIGGRGWSYKSLINVVESDELILSRDGDALSAPRLSPDGIGSAIAPDHELTMIYENGVLSAAVEARVVGWLDNERLLMNTYGVVSFEIWSFTGAHIYNKKGTLVCDLSIPEITSFSVISERYIFSHTAKTVFDLETGYTVWNVKNSSIADVVGLDYVVYVTDAVLYWKSWRLTSIYVESSGSCGAKTPCYSTIQEAIDAAETGTIIKIVEGNYEEDIILNTSKSLTLQGGWDSTFTTQTSYTTINSITISNGTITIDNLVIQ